MQLAEETKNCITLVRHITATIAESVQRKFSENDRTIPSRMHTSTKDTARMLELIL